VSSSERYTALKGMKDIMPPEIHIWQMVERAARDVFASYGLMEIRPPIAEATSLFTRSIGENTDIVEKEMYTFTDKGGRSISLRPEGTASVVRCYVEHHLHTLPAPQKYFYSGPMFRYERPQSGRQRQFYQIGAEAFGSAGPAIDAEIISMLMRFLQKIGLEGLSFQINSIGCRNCRPAYKEALLAFFSGSLDGLCPDCSRRYLQNPLRILDCKVPRCRELRKGAPKITDYLCKDCGEHFDGLLKLLEVLGVSHTVEPDMVRGLDYYTKTIFEVTSNSLGSQNAVAAGGRYDALVKEFGGPDTPAIGFAVGMERIIELLKTAGAPVPVPDVFFAYIGMQAFRESLIIADRLRSAGFWVELAEASSSLKVQMRRADRHSAKYVLILGDDELSSGSIKWKRLADSAQGEIPIPDIEVFLRERL